MSIELSHACLLASLPHVAMSGAASVRNSSVAQEAREDIARPRSLGLRLVAIDRKRALRLRVDVDETWHLVCDADRDFLVGSIDVVAGAGGRGGGIEGVGARGGKGGAAAGRRAQARGPGGHARAGLRAVGLRRVVDLGEIGAGLAVQVLDLELQVAVLVEDVFAHEGALGLFGLAGLPGADGRQEGLEVGVEIGLCDAQIPAEQVQELLLHQVDFGQAEAEAVVAADSGVAGPVLVLRGGVVKVLGGENEGSEEDTVDGAAHALCDWWEALL